MKLVEAQKIETIDDYQIVERDIPAPGDDELLIEVAACGMGYVDALVALGGYQVKPQPPFTPGQEIAGTVVATGKSVRDFAVGDRVMASSFGGGLAEYVTVPAHAAVVIPDNMAFTDAAGFRVNYVTALHALTDRAALAEGERLLIFGAAGGVGSAAIQVGRLLGAEIIAAASTDEKRTFALDAGAHQVIDTDPDGWRDRLKALCGGKGPDIVLDPVCGPLFEQAFRSLAWRGRHLVVGFVGGPIPKLPVNLPLLKGAALTGVDVRQFFLFEPARAAEHLARLLQWIEAGRLVPPAPHIFSLGNFSDAMTLAMSGKAVGKIVVELKAAAL